MLVSIHKGEQDPVLSTRFHSCASLAFEKDDKAQTQKATKKSHTKLEVSKWEINQLPRHLNLGRLDVLSGASRIPTSFQLFCGKLFHLNEKFKR